MAQLQRKGCVSKPVSAYTTARGDSSLDQDISSRSQPGTSAAESSEDNSTKFSVIALQSVDVYLGSCPVLRSKLPSLHSYTRKLG